MYKLDRKTFARKLNYLKPMEKLNLLLEFYENLSKDFKEKSDYKPLKDFLNRYIRHKLKHPNLKKIPDV